MIQVKNRLNSGETIHALLPLKSKPMVFDVKLSSIEGTPVNKLQANDCGWIHTPIPEQSILFSYNAQN